MNKKQSSEDILKQVGFYITELRKRKSLSQGELADQANSSQMTINRLEKGHTGTRLITAIDAAKTLDTSLDILIKKAEVDTSKTNKESIPRNDIIDEIVYRTNKLTEKKQKWILELIKHVITPP